MSRQGLPSACAASLRAALLFLGAGLLLIQPAQAACTDPTDVYVQYKVTRTNLSKCGFPEFVNLDPPRVHVYHKQTTYETYGDHYYTAGCSSATNDLSGYCGGGGTWQYKEGPGCWTNYYSEDLNVTNTEWWFAPSCLYTNICAGTWALDQSRTDTRPHSGQACDTRTISTTYAYSFQDRPLSAQLLEYSGIQKWYWAGTDHTIVKSAGFQSYENFTNDTTLDYVQLLHVPDFVGELTYVDPTNAQYVIAPGTYDPLTTTGRYVVGLSQEYTDDELRGNILGLMPEYPAEWFTPSGSSYDLFQTMAYSVIDGDHINANYWWPPYDAELQKMLYTFAIPNSREDAIYQITWDVITWSTSGSDPQVTHNSCQVQGTGDPAGTTYSPAQEVMPPGWDTGREDWGGLVFSWVDHVRVSVVSGSPGAPGEMPGGPGPLPPGGSPGGCSTCGGGAGSSQSRSDDWPGFGAEFSLGQAEPGFPAGSLATWAQKPTPDLASPAALVYVGCSPYVQVYSVSNQVRQVQAPQTFVDVVTVSPFAYDLRYYLAGQTSGIPFVTWRIENPDANRNSYNRVRVTETRGSDVKVYNYAYDPSLQSWTLDYPGGARQDECRVVMGNAGSGGILSGWLPAWFTNGLSGYTRTVTATTRVPGGPDQFTVQRVYQRMAWGEPLVEETLAPYTNPQTTTYIYDPDVAAGRRGQLLRKVLHYGGSWEWFYYDNIGRLSTVYSSRGNIAPGGDTPPSDAHKTEYDYSAAVVASCGDNGTVQVDTPRLVVDYSGGASYQPYTHYTAFPSASLRIGAQNVAFSDVWLWDAAGSLFTTNRYYDPPDNRLKSVVQPDGTLQTFSYAAGTTYITNRTASGQPNATFSRVIDGTTNVTVLNLANYPVSSTTWDVSTGTLLLQENYSNFDDFGRPQRVTHLDGTHEDTYYACCGVDSTIDRDAVPTQYFYDPMRRQTAATRLGITVTNILDAPGRVVATTRTGSSGPPITQSQSQYNLAGQSVAETNALGGRTTHVQSINGYGALVRTDTYPDGGIRVKTYYRDGTLQSITGSAAHPVRYEYGVESGNYTTGDSNDSWKRYTVEIKLNADGSDSSEWTRTYMDAAGRPYKTFYADSTPGDHSNNAYSQAWYNNQGLLWKQRDPDGVITLHTFNAKAEREYSITVPSDVASGLPDYGTLLSSLNSLQAGTNPITRTVRSVVPAGGGRPDMVRTDTYVWLDGQSTGRLASRAETSTAGLDSWQTVYRDDSTPVVTHSQTAYQGGGARSATAIAPDSSYATSAYSNGRLTSVTRKDSTGAQIGKTTVGYDPHGRQATVADARNGTTTYAFNDADLVTSTTTPNPGVPGGNAQTTTTYYNPTLQATNVVQPDGGSVSLEYWLTGQLKRQYGSRTFPVGYGYDDAGRMNLLTNWSGFPNAGARVTTWNYSPYRGWLDNKRYPDSQGPSYTYTPAGRLSTRAWARAITTTYGYDYAGALSTINYSDSTPDVSYTRDRLGRPRTVLWSGITATFTNNLAGELMGEIYSGGLLAGLSVTNGYDQFLRRTQLAALNSTTPFLQHAFTFDNASRLQTVTDNSAGTAYSATYAYLANSPLVSQITFKQSTATRMTTTKQYDYLNRLSSVRALNSQQSTITQIERFLRPKRSSAD